MADIEMPQLGETVTEGTITRWFKQVGDTVAVDEVLFEVSTDKVDTEVPSTAAGTLSEIRRRGRHGGCWHGVGRDWRRCRRTCCGTSRGRARSGGSTSAAPSTSSACARSCCGRGAAAPAASGAPSAPAPAASAAAGSNTERQGPVSPWFAG